MIDLRATRGRSLIAFMILPITGFVRLFGFLRITVKRLTCSVPKELKGLTGDKIRKAKIVENWPDVLRCIAIMVSGRMQPSHLLKKLAARAKQHDLAFALREIGRVERTLFIIEWLLDRDTQRRANIGMKKGEAHHALKGALRIGGQGEIRDRTTEGQHFRIPLHVGATTRHRACFLQKLIVRPWRICDGSKTHATGPDASSIEPIAVLSDLFEATSVSHPTQK